MTLTASGVHDLAGGDSIEQRREKAVATPQKIGDREWLVDAQVYDKPNVWRGEWACD